MHLLIVFDPGADSLCSLVEQEVGACTRTRYIGVLLSRGSSSCAVSVQNADEWGALSNDKGGLDTTRVSREHPHGRPFTILRYDYRAYSLTLTQVNKAHGGLWGPLGARSIRDAALEPKTFVEIFCMIL